MHYATLARGLFSRQMHGFPFRRISRFMKSPYNSIAAYYIFLEVLKSSDNLKRAVFAPSSELNTTFTSPFTSWFYPIWVGKKN